MDIDYSNFMPKDVVKIIEHVDTISAKKHNSQYAELQKEYNKDYTEKREIITAILDRVSLNYDLIAKPLALKCNEKNLKNIKITDIRYVSVSSPEIGLIDGVFIDYEHFDGWKITKNTVPMKGLEIKLEEEENDGFKSVVWTQDKPLKEKRIYISHSKNSTEKNKGEHK